MLQDTEGAGHPDSHFHIPSLDSWLESYGLDASKFDHPNDALKAVFDAVRRAGSGGDEIFGLRLQRNSFAYFMQQLRCLYPSFDTDKECLEAAFGKTLFIYLSRKDKVGQAVSVVKARQSGLWHMGPDGIALERSIETQKLTYDAEAISAEYDEFVKADADWAAWFGAEHIEPLHISYDALSADPYRELARVTDALGLGSNAAKTGRPPVAKLADAINREWAGRFRREC